jgi:CHAT domain-containing protein/tetratricopeptide (TPR) repeat protein
MNGMTRTAAIVCLALLVPLAGASDSLQVRLQQAKALFDRRAYPDALESLNKLLPDAEAAGDDAVLARSLFYIGRSHYFLSDYRTALPFLERALAVSREAGERSFEAEVLRGIGRLHKQQGTYPDGLRACEQSIVLFDTLGQPREAARTWMTVGAIRDLMGEYQHALAAYEKARAGLQDRKDDEYYTLFNEIAITYTNLGRYEDALAANLIALEGRERLGDAYFIGISHSNIGDAYFALGQYERAIEHYEQCFKLCGQAGEKRSVAVALGQLAQAWMAAGDPRRALGYAERELELTREIRTEHLESVALRHIGDAYASLGDLDESLRHQQLALEMSREAGALADQAATLASIVDLRLRLDQAVEARTLAAQCLNLARQTRSPELEWQAHALLARAARAGGDTNGAVDHLYASVGIIDSVRGRVRTDSGKIGYLDSRQAVYHELADVLHERGRHSDALEIAEAARGRAFSDLLAAQRLELEPDAAASLAAIREAEAFLRAQEQNAAADEPLDARTAQTRAATEAQLAGKLRALRSEQPELASLIAVEPVGAREIAAIAARLDATFVEFLVTERRLLIWVIRPSGEIAAKAVSLGRGALREKVRALHERMNGLTAQELRQPDAIRGQLAELYRWVIAPVADQLPREANELVYVIPHDALLLVPFSALIDETGDYVVKRHTLASVPAANVLRYTATKLQHVVSAGRPHLLALADPEPPQDAALEALPGARREVEQLGRRFPTDRRLTLMGERATEANAKRLSPGQTIVHFAVHGLIRDDRPWESALILTPGDGEDGYFKVPEIFGLDLRADLVTLSGCSTGLGRISGDGIVGLSRALIYAGSPSVLVSQWDVSDVSTAYLMERFYAAMTAGDGKARSLRTAQLATLKRYPHPALWAAFTLVGEP